MKRALMMHVWILLLLVTGVADAAERRKLNPRAEPRVRQQNCRQLIQERCAAEASGPDGSLSACIARYRDELKEHCEGDKPAPVAEAPSPTAAPATPSSSESTFRLSVRAGLQVLHSGLSGKDYAAPLVGVDFRWRGEDFYLQPEFSLAPTNSIGTILRGHLHGRYRFVHLHDFSLMETKDRGDVLLMGGLGTGWSFGQHTRLDLSVGGILRSVSRKNAPVASDLEVSFSGGYGGAILDLDLGPLRSQTRAALAFMSANDRRGLGEFPAFEGRPATVPNAFGGMKPALLLDQELFLPLLDLSVLRIGPEARVQIRVMPETTDWAASGALRAEF